MGHVVVYPFFSIGYDPVTCFVIWRHCRCFTDLSLRERGFPDGAGLLSTHPCGGSPCEASVTVFKIEAPIAVKAPLVTFGSAKPLLNPAWLTPRHRSPVPEVYGGLARLQIFLPR